MISLEMLSPLSAVTSLDFTNQSYEHDELGHVWFVNLSELGGEGSKREETGK